MVVEPVASLVRTLTTQLVGSVTSAATSRAAALVLGPAEHRALRRIVRESASVAVDGFPEVAAISAEIDLLSEPAVADELLRATIPGSRPRWTRTTARWSALYGRPPEPRVRLFLASLASQMRPRLQRSRVLQGLWVAVAMEHQAARLSELERSTGRRGSARRRRRPAR